MNQLLPCPTCQKITLLPAEITSEAKIRCPHCLGDFVLGELLSNHFAHWQVIDDPGVRVASAESSDSVGLAQLEATGGPPERSPESSTQSNEIRLAESGDDQPPARKKAEWSQFQPITHEQFERMKRKSRSQIWQVLQVVLGGLAAIPIGLLLVWHVVGTDVADAGPFVGKYVPWIVPAKFRPYEERGDPRASEPVRRGGGFRQFDVLDANQTLADQGSTEASVEPNSLGDSGRTSQADPVPLALNQAEMANVEPVVDADENDPVTSNIFALITQAEQHLDLWSQAVLAQPADLKQLAQTIYADLRSLAMVIDELPKENPVLRTIRDKMQPIGRTVKRRADVRSLIEQGARYWAHSKTSQELGEDAVRGDIEKTDVIQSRRLDRRFGLAMIVEVQDVFDSDAEWMVVTDTAVVSQEVPIQIHVSKILAPALIPGQKLFLLGILTAAAESSQESAPSAAHFVASYVHAL